MNAPRTTETNPMSSTGLKPTPMKSPWRGLLQAAWQIHRTLVLGGILAAAVLMILLVWLRIKAGSVAEAAAGQGACAGGGARTAECTDAINSQVWFELSFPFAALQLACLLLAFGTGLIIGSSSFARDFEQRTQVFALTQSVRRTPWWATKTAVTVLPMTFTMLALGATVTWVSGNLPYQNQPMEIPQFYISSSGLAIIYLLAVSVASTAGILLRSTIGALAVAAVIVALIGVGGEVARPHLVPADRIISALSEYPVSYGTERDWLVGSGFLNADGQKVDGYYSCPLWSTTTEFTTELQYREIEQKCQTMAGIVSRYTDRIPESRYWQIRAVWSGALILLSALALALGHSRIRHRVL